MTVELGKKTGEATETNKMPASDELITTQMVRQEVGDNGLHEDQKAALQMIEELLNRNWSTSMRLHHNRIFQTAYVKCFWM